MAVLAERGTRGTNIVFVDANGNQLFTAAHPGYVAFATMPSVTIAGSYKEHRLLSTDEKPTTDNSKGDAVLEIDTGDVYIWNGTSWEAF